MPTFTVLLSDAEMPGNEPGTALARFLETFAPGETRVARPADLLDGPAGETKHLFVGLPTSFGPRHAARLRWQRLFPFDYVDEPPPRWAGSDEAFLRPLAAAYLKTHTIDGHDHGLPVGLLPVPYNPAIGVEYRRRRSRAGWRRLGARLGRAERPWDVTLLGAATYLGETAKGAARIDYHQRVEWMREVRAQAAWRAWGGLTPLSYCPPEEMAVALGPLDGLWWTGKRLRFRDYFTRLARTRVALAPTGHARWTYRHVESVYADCDVLSTDLSGVRLLVPAPVDCYTTAADRAPIAPLVAGLLAGRERLADRRAAALAHFERYFYEGGYDRRRPLPFERFVAQLEG